MRGSLATGGRPLISSLDQSSRIGSWDANHIPEDSYLPTLGRVQHAMTVCDKVFVISLQGLVSPI